MNPDARDATYNTPNTAIPLNNRMPGEIADIAWEQLKRYREAATCWPVQFRMRDYRSMYVCRYCEQCLWFLKDTKGVDFWYTPAEKDALIIAHIRQCHSSMIGEKGEVSESSAEFEVLDNTGCANPASEHPGNDDRPVDQSRDSRGIEYT